MIILYKALLILLLAILAGACYRYGGWEGGKRWVREVGVGLCLVLGFVVLNLFNLGSLLCLGSVWIETTYFKKKGTDANWFNWLLVGLSFSVATLPWLICNTITHRPLHLIGYGIRVVVCAVFTVIWEESWSPIVASLFHTTTDITDECGRGAIQILTLPLLLI